MIKTLRLLLAFVTSLLAGLVLPQAGSAQFFDRPQFLEPVLPIGEILYAVEERGFAPISRPRLRGDVYVVEVIDRSGRRVQLSVDAYDGIILGSVRPRGVIPAPIYRDVRPLVPFEDQLRSRGGYEERFVPDRGVRDLRDPSTRGSSVRIETVPLRRDRDRARVVPTLPDSGPLPPARPPGVAMLPAFGPTLPPESERAAPESPQPPEPAALPRNDFPRADEPELAEQATERPQPQAIEPPASSPAREEPPPQAGRQARSEVEQSLVRRVEPALRPRTRSLLDDFGPDELDQLDMYPPGTLGR